MPAELTPEIIAATDAFLRSARAHQVHASIRALSGGPGPDGCYQTALRHGAAAEKAARLALENAVQDALRARAVPQPVANAIDALADTAHEQQTRATILAMRGELADVAPAPGADCYTTEHRNAEAAVTAARLAFERLVRDLLVRPPRTADSVA